MKDYIEKTLYDLTHRDNVPNYCLLDNFTETIGDYKDKDIHKVIELVQLYNYDVYTVGRQDELDDTYLIVDKKCDLNNIKEDYLNFFSVNVILKKVNTKEEVKVEEQLNKIFKRK